MRLLKTIAIALLTLFLLGCHNYDSSKQPETLKKGEVVVIFFSGLNGSDKGGLLDIQRDVEKHLPDDTVTRMYWDDGYADPDSKLGKMILAENKELVFVGHSFGGCKAVDLAAAYEKRGKKIKKVILLDPVPITHIGLLNFIDFTLPNNVQKATCFKRNAIIPPYSCAILNKGPQYENITIRSTGHSLGFLGMWLGISQHPDRAEEVIERIVD